MTISAVGRERSAHRFSVALALALLEGACWWPHPVSAEDAWGGVATALRNARPNRGGRKRALLAKYVSCPSRMAQAAVRAGGNRLAVVIPACEAARARSPHNGGL